MPKKKADWTGKLKLKKGSLRKEIHEPKGKKIPQSVLKKDSHSKNKLLRERATLAENFSKMRKR